MIFSYGFVEDTVVSAKVMFLDLDVPDDDPLRPAKLFVSTEAPGFRLFDKGDEIGWESDFIWLVVINEEDGLEFKIRQTIDGGRDIQALWKEQELDTSKLGEHIREDPAWDIYQLRAVVLLQERVKAQREKLQEVRSVMPDNSIREVPRRLAGRLGMLELDMLERAVAALELQVSIINFLGPALQPSRYPVKPWKCHCLQGFLFLLVTIWKTTTSR